MPIQCLVCLHYNPDTQTACTQCGSPLDFSESSEQVSYHLGAGTVLCQGKYKVEKIIGQGGFGIAYKGFDITRGKAIAIKEYWPENAGRQGKSVIWPLSVTPQQQQKEIQDLKNEVSRIKRCVHPNIVRAYDDFEENNTIYVVMNFIEGKSLLAILEASGTLPENRVIKYFIQLADALKVIHGNQILHRDIKADNIMIDKNDNAILIDFGSAREFVADKTQQHTRVLTPGYAPYEQYLSKAKPGPATDIYALCASMYELLTGKLPPPALDRKAADTLEPPRQLVPNLSQVMEQVILTGMRIEAADRFQTADEVIDALRGKFVSPSLRRSRQLVEQHKLAEAVQAYHKCLANEPNNGSAAVELALVQTYVNDSQAEVAAQKAIQLQPQDGRGYGVLGLVNCRKANWVAAVKHLQQAASLSPNESWIQANLAWALGKSGNWQQAETAVAKALQLDSNSTFALGLQAWIAVNQQQWKPAIRAARQALAKSKQTNANNHQELQRWVYPCLIVALDKAVVTTQASDVTRCIQEFITQVPDSAFVWGFKGSQQANLALWADAISSFEQAISKGTVSDWVWLNLAITREHLKNPQAAIQAYELYNQKFPNNPFALFRLGTLLGQQGQWRTARSHLAQAIQLKSDYAEAYHNLGWVLLNIRGNDGHVENFTEMKSAYSKAVELYSRQNKSVLASSLKQAFRAIGIEI